MPGSWVVVPWIHQGSLLMMKPQDETHKKHIILSFVWQRRGIVKYEGLILIPKTNLTVTVNLFIVYQNYRLQVTTGLEPVSLT